MDPKTLKRILVPTDFSDPSREAIATAVSLARLSGASLDLVHVEVGSSYVLPPPLDLTALPLGFGDRTTHATAELAAEVDVLRAAGLVCDSATLVGRPDDQIVTHAIETNADLIVMGTHGRSGLAHVLFGSVAEKVVQREPCPVLIVPRAKRAPTS